MRVEICKIVLAVELLGECERFKVKWVEPETKQKEKMKKRKNSKQMPEPIWLRR